MPGFCGNCGSPIAPGVKFCSKCGASIPGAAVQPSVQPAIAATPPAPFVPAPAPVAATPPAQQGGGSALKIILIIVAVFVFLLLAVAGGCFYVAYRVRQKAHEISQQMGGDATPYTGKRDPCLLSSSEVGAILHEPVQAGESRGNTCEYPFGNGGNHRLDVEFTWKGGTMAMKFAHGVQSISGMDTFTTVPNVGDEAYIAPGGSALIMRKGDVMVNMDLRTSGVSADAAEKIAAKIADRL